MMPSRIPNTVSRHSSARRTAPLSQPTRREDGHRSAGLNPAASSMERPSSRRNTSRSLQRSPITARTVASATSADSRARSSTGAAAAAAAAHARSIAPTSSSRMARNDSTRRALRSSVMATFRSWRQCSP